MIIIRNKSQEAAIRIWQETLLRVRADVLMRQLCWRDGNRLYIGGSEFDLASFDRVLVLGAGKASAAMALAIEEFAPVEGLIATKYGHAIPLKRTHVIEAGHPIPDENSIRAGEAILALASTASARDLVLVLISGGASALIEAPIDGVSLQQIAAVTESMLRRGSNIGELNAVRSCLSRIKAGGLARACGDAHVVCLVLSDVIGNSRGVIGSGPCWGAPSATPHAQEVLREFGLPCCGPAEPVYPEHVIVGDIYTLLEAAQAAAEELGMRPKVYGRTFEGEARDVGALMAAEALALKQDARKYDCVIAAGETTVTVDGNGLGGRNQELACAAALALEAVDGLAVLAAGTDGTDGPTKAAGGIVDGSTCRRTNLRRALDQNDSYHALEAANALIITGPTQTNLNDLVVITVAAD